MKRMRESKLYDEEAKHRGKKTPDLTDGVPFAMVFLWQSFFLRKFNETADHDAQAV
jgi:hypothetical protein